MRRLPQDLANSTDIPLGASETRRNDERGKTRAPDTHLLSKSLRAIVYPCDEPPLLRLIHPRNSGPTKVLHELGEGDPAGSVHVQMVLVLDKLLIDRVRLDALRAEAAREELDEVVLELRAEVGDVPARVLAYDEHLTKVGLRLGAALEAILVSALLLADLAVPPKPLQALRLHLVRDVLWRSDCH